MQQHKPRFTEENQRRTHPGIASLAHPQVPCIRSWVHARVRTGKLAPGAEPAPHSNQQRPEPATAAPRYADEASLFPTLPKRCGGLQNTRRLCRFYTILCDGVGWERRGTGLQPGTDASRGGHVDNTRAPSGWGVHGANWIGARLVAAMVEEGFAAEDLDRTPLGLTLPLLEVLHAARSQAPADWPTAAQELVGRQDLSALRRMIKAGVGGISYSADAKDEEAEEEDSVEDTGGYWGGGRISSSGAGGRDSGGAAAGQGSEVGINQAGGGASSGGGNSAAASRGGGGGSGEVADLDGLSWVDELSSLRFGRDRRVREACRLLRGSRPVRFHVERSPESSDHDHQQRQQTRLLQLAMRTLAGPTGRGMLTLGTLAPLLAEPLPIPPLCLAGRIRKPADVVVNLDLAAAAVSPDTTAWAEFHNGVAAGLRLRHDWGGAGGAATYSRNGSGRRGGSKATGGFEEGGVSRTWITYNRPAGGANNAHGGLLMALGLQGHLSSLAMTDVFEYLTLGQESTTVGVLLGMAAARRGSADLSTHKVTMAHAPELGVLAGCTYHSGGGSGR